MNRYKKIICSILVCVLMVTAVGCGKTKNSSTKKYDGNYIFYVSRDKDKLENEQYKTKSSDTLEQVDEMIKKLTGKAIPKKVIVNSYNLLDGILTLDFSEEYLEISKDEEVLIRAAVVLTLTQIESVDYVAFTVNDSALTRRDGTIIGNMQATDFVDNYGSDNNIVFSTRFILYYGNEDSSNLKECDVMENYTGEESKEKFIVKRLIEGPDEKGYNRIFSKDIKLISVMTTDNICYVNFNSNFLTEQIVGSPELAIYSIVNSLSELNYVHKVQIMVNGDTNVSFKGVKLDNAFIRNLDYIENETKEGE